MKKHLLFTLSLILISNILAAQVFLSPYKYAPGQKKVFVILNDDTQVGGQLVTFSRVLGYVNAITLQDENGTKQKFKTDQMKEILVEATKDDKYANKPSDNRLIMSKKKRKKTKDLYAALSDLDYFVWRKVANRKGKAKMMQLVNPGYDDKIAIYVNGAAPQTTAPAMVGGFAIRRGDDDQEKSYYVVKNNEDPKLIKKTQYKKMFSKLFGDCPSIKVSKPKWKDFPLHVFAYDECN